MYSRKGWALGFTLVEVLITVAIVGILAGIALPSYLAYVQRGKIVEASASLNDMRTRLEQYYLDHRRYPDGCIAPASGMPPRGTIYLPSGSKYFGITCDFPSKDTSTITATGNAAYGMDGFAYTINESNVRRTTSLPAGWAGIGNACWVNRKSGDC